MVRYPIVPLMDQTREIRDESDCEIVNGVLRLSKQETLQPRHAVEKSALTPPPTLVYKLQSLKLQVSGSEPSGVDSRAADPNPLMTWPPSGGQTRAQMELANTGWPTG